MSVFSTSFFYLLISRFVQAVGVGISMPLFQTIILYLFPKNRRGFIMGIAGIIISLAPAIGPSLSGFILVKYSWHMLFIMLIPLIVIAIIMTFLFMKPVLPIEKSKLDIMSVVESSIGLGLLLYGLSLFSAKNMNKWVLISSIVIGLLFTALFIKRQYKLKNPFLDMHPLKVKNYRLSIILIAMVNMAMISFELVIPMYIQNVRHLSPLDSGLSLLPGAILLGIMSPIGGKLFDKYGPRGLNIIGMTLLTVFTTLFVFIKMNTPMPIVIFCYAMRLLGVSMVMMPATTFGMNALPNNQLGNGTVINKTTKQVASSFGTAVMISIMTMAMNLANHQTKQVALLDGYRAAFAVASVFCIITLLISLKIPKQDPDQVMAEAKSSKS